MEAHADTGKVEQELVVLLSCKKDDTAREMKSYTRFISVASPKAANASLLMECLSHSLLPLGITDLFDQKNVLGVEGKPVLVGGGTDRMSVNVAQQKLMV